MHIMFCQSIDTILLISYKNIMPIKKSFLFIFLIIFLFSACISEPVNNQPVISNTKTEYKTVEPSREPSPTVTPTIVPSIRIKNADNLFFNGDYDTAANEYDAVLHQSGDPEIRGAAQYGLGRILYEMKDYQTAAQAFITVIEYYSRTSSFHPAVFYLGLTYSQLKQYEQAADIFDKYISMNPSLLDSYIYELKGNVLSASGDHEKAIEAYQSSISSSLSTDTLDIALLIAQEVAATGDHNNAIKQFLQIYSESTNDYVKSAANLLAGRSYLALGMPEQAYARFQDSVHNFPAAYDSYSALAALVEADQEVSQLDRGIIDYNVGRYGLAMDALYQYIKSNPQDSGTAHYYRALSAQSMGDYSTAVQEYSEVINGFPDNPNWLDAWQNKSYVLWYRLLRYDQAAQTLSDFVSLYPNSNQAPDFLFQVGRLYERSENLVDAASTWERLIKEYPGAEISSRALFLAAITNYRMSKFDTALLLFQKYLVLSTLPEDQAGALLWIGKSQIKLGNNAEAQAAWSQAAQNDPYGFYGNRCQELLLNNAPLTSYSKNNFNFDLASERPLAEKWLKSTFLIPPETDLSNLGELSSNVHLMLGDAYWDLGLITEASAEYDLVRNAVIQDPVNNYRLLNHLYERRFYKQSILISRQILDLAGLDDSNNRNAPIYFNHIRYGTYYWEIIEPVAEQYNIDPAIIFSMIRQESFFEGHAGSPAGAMGLMQLIPSTGKEVASSLGYPPDFKNEDLLRPIINIILGTNYVSRQRTYYNNDIYKMLAAYNAGPGKETQDWINISNNDPDLFIEVVRYSETRTYIMNIAGFINFYRFLYENTANP